MGSKGVRGTSMRKKEVMDRIALDIKRGGYHTTESASAKVLTMGKKSVLPIRSIQKRIPNLEYIKINDTALGNKTGKIKTTENTIIFVRQNLDVHHLYWHYFEKEHLNNEEEDSFIRILEKKGWQERKIWPPRQAEFHRFKIKRRIFTGWTEPATAFWFVDPGETMHQEELPNGDQDRDEMVASILEVIQARAGTATAEFNRKLEEERHGESFGFTRSTLACQDAVLYLPRFGG
jgi:hypothetical protein